MIEGKRSEHLFLKRSKEVLRDEREEGLCVEQL